MLYNLRILKELQRLINEKTLSQEFCKKINLEQRLIDKIVFIFEKDGTNW
ncbi:hypothetical protein ACNSOL_11595 (plasmid) [Aliarcobacter lanthieri]